MQVALARRRAWSGRIIAVALLAALSAGCGGGVGQVELSATAGGVAPPPAATSTFQGTVTTIDDEAGTIGVAVRIVWAPVLEARSDERQVLVDAFTKWVPEPGGIAQVRPGEEIQVEAEDTLDGTWRATRVLLMDID